ncbi:enolase C-terminal domain-like protein [Photobacterium minamisatsumaniensis]|uniref:enolase C-terminal domain-like protein n=1 Tax=Photobacterium minamisatsumaniensis TaxID=2910233 RepID=UPI003D0A6B6B
MSKIINVRPVLLSAPYGFEGCAENVLHLPHGTRGCSIVEITLSNGIKGLGEGYLGVFAPEVFTSIVHLISKAITGDDIANGYQATLAKAKTVTAYWSLQGAAQHAISAIEIALVDALSRSRDIPAVELFGGKQVDSIAMYGSGGDSLNPTYMAEELAQLAQRGIGIIKIRARHNQVDKTVWTINAAKKHRIRVAVDMTQNLTVAGQTAEQVLAFCHQVQQQTGEQLVFVEECLGLDKLEQLPQLAENKNIVVAGGEIVTTKEELFQRIDKGYYNIIQPDASVLGGIEDTIAVCNAAHQQGINPVVHSWGGPVAMMANYIAAFATGCSLIEYPMPHFALRHAMCDLEARIINGHFHLGDDIGLGVTLTPELEAKYSYEETALYHCFPVEDGLVQLEKSHQNWRSCE